MIFTPLSNTFRTGVDSVAAHRGRDAPSAPPFSQVPFEELTLSSASHAGPPKHPPTLHLCARLDRFNAAPAPAAESVLLGCCGSRRWARRLADHRPYPDLDALLAAADEAAYDLSPDEISAALAGESSARLGEGAPATAHTALRAAHAAYESGFGHAFVICLDGFRPEEHLDQILAAIRSRLGNAPDEERAVASDELRRLARGRLARLVTDPQKSTDCHSNADHAGHNGDPRRPDSPSVAV